MHQKTRFAVLVSGLALMLAPAAALAHTVEYEVESPPKAKPKPGPNASLAQKTKAYGGFCRAFPRKHVAGQPGTPYSQCLTAMAKVATVRGTTAGRACATFSKKPVAGGKATPFAQCVVAAGKVRRQLRS
jgi:hypothetical protein